MKLTRVALAAAVVVACVCLLQTEAVPFTQTEETETPQENEHLTETNPNLQSLFRVKRQSHLSLCRYCCNCCRNKGCGYCCKF
ncbi:hepcidin-1 isoform X2 [Puntigrus tetrazona]|uniref:hepcidin-1 isoform X2 n=1 Tax=Puntigrus tetrazona TaxID=1606681 RepID=UPI001C899B32|nr:hepcidin-1 isoform X2 [Puntigrus tetrazona]